MKKPLFSMLLLCISTSVFGQFTASGVDLYHTGGSVGIGITNPSNLLDIAGSFGNTVFDGNKVTFTRDGNSILDANSGLGNSQLLFRTQGVNALTIDKNQNVGIGTTSPNFRLTVGANLNNSYNSTPEVASRGIMTHGIGSGVPYFYLHRDDVTISSGNALGIIKFTGADGGELSGALIKSNATGNWSATNSQASLEFHTTSPGEITTSPKMSIQDNGNIGIGTTTPGNKLEVNGTIRSKRVKVEATGWPDYVFSKNYTLNTLEEVEEFIEQNQHLPEVPSANEVERKGLDLGNMDATLLKKVEELTLYMIDMDKKIKKQEERIKELEKENLQLRRKRK